jgi:hypothetical protein
MSTQVQFRRGNTSQTNAFTGALAEITVDTDKKTVVVHDGITAGGFALALESAQQDAQAFAKANSAFHQANAAYAQANTSATDITVIQGVNLTQNTNTTTAQTKADNAFHQANAAYIQANTNASNITVIQAVNVTQNTSISNIELVNLTQNVNITAAQTKADNSFNQANASYVLANTNANDIVVIQGVNLTQNTNISNIEGVNLTQNTNITNAQNKADSSFHQANAAFATANNEAGVNATQNTNITNAQNSASAAFLRANNSLNSNVGGTITGNVTIIGDTAISGNLTISGNAFSLSVGTLVANDSLIILGAGNYTSDILDIGFAGHYNDGANAHTGLIRDVNDPSFAIDTLNANLKSSFVTISGISVLPYINAAFDKANNESGVNLTQNTNITAAQTKADNAFHQANAAYATANNESGVNLTQNNSITAAFTAANSAGVYANGAFAQANTDFTNVSVSSGTYGNATHYGVVTVAANGRVTNVQTFAMQDPNSLAFAIALG